MLALFSIPGKGTWWRGVDKTQGGDLHSGAFHSTIILSPIMLAYAILRREEWPEWAATRTVCITRNMALKTEGAT